MVATIDYQSHQPFPNCLTLEESPEAVRLIFPPPKPWLRRFKIASAIIFPSILAFMFAWMTRAMLQMVSRGLPMRLAVLILALPGSYLVVSTFTAVITVFADRRCGHVPNLLSVSNGQLVWSYRGIFGIKHRPIQTGRLISLTVEQVPDIFRGKNTFRIRLRFKRRFPFVRRFKTADELLPAQIGKAFRRALNIEDMTTPAA